MLRQYSVFLARFSNGTYQHFAESSFEAALYDAYYHIEHLSEPDVDLISIELDTEVSPVLTFRK